MILIFFFYEFALNMNFILLNYSFVVLYQILPETEGRTLEDIELHFSDADRKLTDRFIVNNSSSNKENKWYHCNNVQSVWPFVIGANFIQGNLFRLSRKINKTIVLMLNWYIYNNVHLCSVHGLYSYGLEIFNSYIFEHDSWMCSTIPISMFTSKSIFNVRKNAQWLRIFSKYLMKKKPYNYHCYKSKFWPNSNFILINDFLLHDFYMARDVCKES